MKASEMIKKLQQSIEEYGDLDLLFRTPKCKGYRKATINRVLCYNKPNQLFVVDLDK